MVSKLWHSIYASLKLHRLAVIDLDVQQYSFGYSKWYNSNRPIREAERCRPAVFCRLVEKPQLSNLSHLVLIGRPRQCPFYFGFSFDLNRLNGLNLVQLEIDVYLVNHVYLTLPKLKVLAFHPQNYCYLSVDCPQLNTLFYHNDNWAGVENLLEIKHPETIRKLETNVFGSELKQFENVECLVTKRFGLICEDTLRLLPKLKRFHYIRNIEDLILVESGWFGNEIGTVDQMKQIVTRFLADVKRLKGSDFLFSFYGFQLTASVKLEQIDFGVHVNRDGRYERVWNEYVYMNNYHLIEPGALDFINCVNYTGMLSQVNGALPHCFSQKFTGITCVSALTKVPDAKNFLCFLESLRFLRRLELLTTGLDQEFFDQLPVTTCSLVRLELYGNQENEPKNFDFIGKFSGLLELGIYWKLSSYLISSFIQFVNKLERTFYSLQEVNGLE